MEFTKPLENLIAASYLSGAGEAFKKSKALSGDEVEKHVEDIKRLRRKLLNRAESDGYQKPVHHIEEAKRLAANVLKGITPPANVPFAESLFGSVENLFGKDTSKPTTDLSMEHPLSNVQQPVTSMEQPVTSMSPPLSNMTPPVTSMSPPVTNVQQPLTNVQQPVTSMAPMSSPTFIDGINKLTDSINTMKTNMLAQKNSSATLPSYVQPSETVQSETLPTETKPSTTPLLQLGGKKSRRTKRRTNRKKKTLRK